MLMDILEAELMNDDSASEFLAHYGVMGQKKGVRRWQNKDMSLTPEGRIHYGVGEPRKRGYFEQHSVNNIKDLAKLKDQDERMYNLSSESLAKRKKNQSALEKEVIKAEENYTNAYNNLTNYLKSSKAYMDDDGDVFKSKQHYDLYRRNESTLDDALDRKGGQLASDARRADYALFKAKSNADSRKIAEFENNNNIRLDTLANTEQTYKQAVDRHLKKYGSNSLDDIGLDFSKIDLKYTNRFKEQAMADRKAAKESRDWKSYDSKYRNTEYSRHKILDQQQWGRRRYGNMSQPSKFV